jgi:outer membrane receptor protein involved in Fe transport
MIERHPYMRALLGGGVLLWTATTVSAQAPAVAKAQPPMQVTVTVVETAPVPGIDLPIDKIGVPVQVATASDIESSGASNVPEFLGRRLTGVYVNEIQNNPFQVDVNYRGYTASPLLGTPQGLSIYMDGMRLNQPFGEVVSWDLIPKPAIASTTLIPGANPLFGLNTLGGALSIQTKDGVVSRGTSVEMRLGADARRSLDAEQGGSLANGFNWYAAGTLFSDEGWRDDSPSDVRQLFGKAGWQRGASSLSASAGYADNSLTGNGLQDVQFLARDYASVYTKPDTTDNRSAFVNVTGRHTAGRALVTGNVYFRRIRTHAFNGDLNEDALDQSLYQPNASERAALAAAGYTGVPASGVNAGNTPFPSYRCIANALLGDEPGEQCNGLLNTTTTAQHDAGATAQVTRRDTFAGGSHQFSAGGAVEWSGADFGQASELGYVNPDRSITGVGVFGDGVSGGEVDGEPYDTRVDLHGRVHTWSLYAADTLSFGNRASVTLSGRFNQNVVRNRDRIHQVGEPGSLDGDHAFRRFNPAAAATVTVTPALHLYAGYNEGSRAPTSIELGCADPDQPCKLPNAMAGDPPLDQVVSRTVDAGLRGHGRGITWSAGAFHGVNSHDIQFVTSGQTGFGYFTNVARTRRWGMEAAASARAGRVSLGANYTYLNATFQSEESLNGESNSTNDEGPGLEGTIDVMPGDRIPLVPAHMLKVYGSVEVTPALTLDADVVAVAGSYARGNENNAHEPDGVYYLGPGRTDPFAVVNVSARYRLRRWLQAFAQIENLLDTRYDTAAQLGATGFTTDGAFLARPFPAVDGEFPLRHTTFVAPGAPRRAFAGVRLRF